jgi:hypothetical protein
MLMPTDQIGNPLLVDDLVLVQSGDQSFIGVVKEIKEPSILAPGKDAMHMPGLLLVALMPMTIPFDARNPRVPNVTKIVKPPNFSKKAD